MARSPKSVSDLNNDASPNIPPASQADPAKPHVEPIGGAGNNLSNPALNPVPGSPELHIAAITGHSVDGINARTISNVVSTQADGVSIEDPTLSANIYVFGQFLDHDISLKQTGTGDISIVVPAGDPDLPAGTIIPLTRAATDPTTGTEINTVSGNLDLSEVYGSDAATASSLRNADGTLKTSSGNALPIDGNGNFISGDVRVMENPELIAMTTLFMREHNRLVVELHAQHPGWNGDRLYNEARAIDIAQEQNIVYHEFLPSLIGQTATGTYHGYNPGVNVQATQEFTVAAFRVGHSQISNEQTGIDNNGNVVFTQSLADAFFNTPSQDVSNGIDALLRDLPNDDSQATDVYAVNSLRNLLAAPPNAVDLIATDIQRERDAGLGTLNQTRTALHLTPYTSFAQLTSDTTVAAHLQQVYTTIDNVDLFIGGLAENHASNGGVVGPTFQAIIADQFDRLRTGDRFFFENEGFSKAELANIKATTLSDIISRNTGTPVLQDNAFLSTPRHLSSVAAEDADKPQLIIGVDQAGAAIVGGNLGDTIAAGNADGQTLTGGGGADKFVFQFANHNYTISDFVPGTDSLSFLLGGTSKVGKDTTGNAVITNGTDNVTLTGVAPKDFRAADDNSAAARAHFAFAGIGDP